MDQLFTSLWGLAGWFRAFTPPADAINERASCQAPILNLPADVLLLIGDHLDVPTTMSLSLACRSTYSIFQRDYKKMRPQDQKQLLTLLERDPLGRGSYYCHPCNKLHPFHQTWGPHSEEEGQVGKKEGAGLYNCGNRDRFAPAGNSYDLTYVHARLVMNSHFYGPECGIPIENICIEHSERREATDIRCFTSAKILDDELFLRRTYTFTVNDADAREFRQCTGARDFRLCEHTSFFSSSSVYRQYVPELQKKAPAGGEGLVRCRETPGSCGLCLMDYDITIEPAAGQDACVVRIRAYHQLGACRSPDDWKWARFTEACRPHLFFPNRPNRRGSVHNPGTVRKRWYEAESRVYEAPAEQSAKGGFGFSGFSFPTGLWRDAKPLGYKG